MITLIDMAAAVIIGLFLLVILLVITWLRERRARRVLARAKIDLEKRLVERTDQTNRLYYQHISDDPEHEFIPYLCRPMNAQGEVLGLIHLQGRQGQAVAEYEALALANLNQRETLHTQAIRYCRQEGRSYWKIFKCSLSTTTAK